MDTMKYSPDVVDPNPTVLPDAVRAETVRTLLDKRVLDRSTAAKALLALRVSPTVSAFVFGYDSVPEFLQEFVQPARHATDADTPGFEPWAYAEMISAVQLRFGEQHASHQEIADELGRTVKSVQSFFRRTFSQGLTVESAIWDLLDDGNSVEDVVTVADLPKWRVEFVNNAKSLAQFCTVQGFPSVVIRFV